MPKFDDRALHIHYQFEFTQRDIIVFWKISSLKYFYALQAHTKLSYFIDTFFEEKKLKKRINLAIKRNFSMISPLMPVKEPQLYEFHEVPAMQSTLISRAIK